MKQIVFYTGMAGMLFATSCDKQKLLLIEKSQVEIEIARKNEEIRGIDASLFSFGPDPVSAKITIDRQTTDLMSANQQLEKQLAEITSRCTEGEATIERLKAKVDAYKANHHR